MTAPATSRAEGDRVLDAYRRWGYLSAALDPLDRLRLEPHPELEPDHPAAGDGRRWYCGSIGAEFMHIPEPSRRLFIQQRLEAEPEPVDAEHILRQLATADLFEQFLQSRYLGTKRFSVQGVDALLPLLDELLETIAGDGGRRVVLAMSHRGRLSVMHQTVGRPASELLTGFEDTDPRSVLGGGDVKYHLGATGTFHSRRAGKVALHLVSNPSHLEAVDPVAAGRARAWQTRLGDDARRLMVPIVVHGDAAFAGQGVLSETLNLASVEGFDVGGTLHVVANNLIGFTATPPALHSSLFAAAAALRLPIPILHVSAEDPDAVVRVARLAADYRFEFKSDVVIDLIGYRRFGHSEIDDPTLTQPQLYGRISERPPVWKLYAEIIGVDAAELEAEIRAALEPAYEEAKEATARPVMRRLPEYWDSYRGGRWDPKLEVNTGLTDDRIEELMEGATAVPDGFALHPKIEKLLEQRRRMGRGEGDFDYGAAETAAFAALLTEGHLVRLSGQDSRRGTFSQRQAVLYDVETGAEHLPLEHLARDQAPFRIYDSVLSEAAVLGFEFGFSRDWPDGLICWEAQFGDFANGAQVIIDQFMAAAEDKWDLLSGLVMLLPHGYEGQGPEHSSARLERFLQLCAEDNIQVAQPTSAAQYFHLLRRQAIRTWRKPLVVMTPKSMLRHPAAGSPREELTRDRFQLTIPEEVPGAERLIFCTGKLFHELRAERKRRADSGVAIVAVEQLYPFPEDEIRESIRAHPQAAVIWMQEEPANMGALSFVMPRLFSIVGRKRALRSIKRSASASPATGSLKAHQVEQKTLLGLAFR